MVAASFEMVRQMDVDETRLDDGIPVAIVHLDDLLHPGEGDHHAAADGQTAPRQTRSRPAWHKRHVELMAQLDDRHDLLGRGGKDDHVGALLLNDVPVALIDQELFGFAEQPFVTHDFSQAMKQRRNLRDVVARCGCHRRARHLF